MKAATPLRMGAVEWALLIVLSVLWGGTYFLTEIGLEGFAPLTMAFGRVAIGSMVLMAVLAATGTRLPLDWKFIASVLVLSLLNNVLPFSLNFWSQTRITASLAAILNATSPLITIVLAQFLTSDERITPQKAVGALLGLAGVAILIGPRALDGFSLDVLAQLGVLVSATSFCLASIWARRVTGASMIAVATLQCLLSAIILAPISLIVDQPWNSPMPSLMAWSALLGLALFTTALAYIVYFRLIRSSGATNMSLATFLVPVSAILLSTVFLGETLDEWEILGMISIAAGLLVVDGRPIRMIAAAVAGSKT